MKLRLLAGTINDYTEEEGWRNFTLDAQPRPVWNHDLNMAVLPDFVADIADLSAFRGQMFDEIRFHHVLEHLPASESDDALSGLWRILKVGGILDIEVPDLDRVVSAYAAGELDLAGASQWLLGEQLPTHSIYDCHRSVWTAAELGVALAGNGFEPGERQPTGHAIRFLAERLAS